MLELIEKGEPSPEHPHPLLFVHGAFQGAWSWEVNFLDFFAERGFRVLAPSLRGHSSSPTDKPLRLCSISDFVNDLASCREYACATADPGRAFDGRIHRAEVSRKKRRAGRRPARIGAPARTSAIDVAHSASTPVALFKVRAQWKPGRHVWGTMAGARDLIFTAKRTNPDQQGAMRLQPDCTRAILVDMVCSTRRDRSH